MKRVTVLGCGSGGGLVIDLVARDPRVGTVFAWDRDRFEPPNHARHLAPPSWTGRWKVDFVKERLEELRPDLRVEGRALDILDAGASAQLREDLSESDLILDALDSDAASSVVDEMRRALGKTAIAARVLAGGIGGFLAILSPGTGCWSCLHRRLGRETTEPAPPSRDYADPRPEAPGETRVPASFAIQPCIIKGTCLMYHGILFVQRRSHGSENHQHTSKGFRKAVPVA